MPEVQTMLSDQEMARVRAAAEQAGMTVEEFVTHAANAELRRRYVIPKKDGQLLHLPVRSPESEEA